MDTQAALPTQGNRVRVRHGAQGRTKMKTILRAFSFLLCASFVIFWPAHASAQSRGADACAVLAGRITSDFPGQVTSGARFSIFAAEATRERATRDLVVHSRLKVRAIGARYIEDQNTRRAVDRFSRRPGVRGPERVARQND